MYFLFYCSQNIPAILVVEMASSVVDLAHHVLQAGSLPTLTGRAILILTTMPSASALLHRPRSLGLGMWTTSNEGIRTSKLGLFSKLLVMGFESGA